MTLQRKLVDFARKFGLDVLRYNHPQRMATDSTYAIGKLLSPGPVGTILDVGANLGQSALAYRQQFPQADVYSFEPTAATFEQLRTASQHDPKIHPYQLAISDSDENKTFFMNEDHTTNSFLEPSTELNTIRLVETMKPAGTATVICTTLDLFCEQEGLAEIDILKMDIQGAELQALWGADRLFRAGRIKLVFCEVQFSPLYKNACEFSQIATAMKEFGYPLYGIYNLHHFLDDGLLWGDAIFVNPTLLSK